MPDLFGASETDLPAQIAEVRRELAQRERAYPRFIEKGQLTKPLADKRVRVMEAVLATLEGLERERRAGGGR